MNKAELIKYIATKNSCTLTEAERAINLFTRGIEAAIYDGNEVSLIGFGNFGIREVAAREGRNPRTGEAMQIAVSKQVRFKVGQKLKDAANGIFRA